MVPLELLGKCCPKWEAGQEKNKGVRLETSQALGKVCSVLFKTASWRWVLQMDVRGSEKDSVVSETVGQLQDRAVA